MIKSISWYEKYNLALQETLSIKEIMKLRNVGQPKAMKIRHDVLEYCLANNIHVDSKRVPTEIVFIVTNLDLNYYYEKMVFESKSKLIEKGSLNYVSA